MNKGIVEQQIESRVISLENSIKTYNDKKSAFSDYKNNHLNESYYIEKYAFFEMEDKYKLSIYQNFLEVFKTFIRSLNRTQETPNNDFLIKYCIDELKYTELPSTISNYSLSIINQWKASAYHDLLSILTD